MNGVLLVREEGDLRNVVRERHEFTQLLNGLQSGDRPDPALVHELIVHRSVLFGGNLVKLWS